MSKTLPEGNAWTITPSRRWFARCDRCDTWRFVANYYEVYGMRDDHPAWGGGWWWECAQCLINTITDYAERKAPVKS